jgi:hypothetical protein
MKVVLGFMARLGNSMIVKALTALGARCKLDRKIEILLVGGAAGVLIGALPAAWTTADVDLLHVSAAEDRDTVLEAAADVARQLSLPNDWLNDWSSLFSWTLPDGWQNRRHHVGTFGRLIVYAASRLDLIAMKLLAHRPQDLEHLEQMNVRSEDLDFVRIYLDSRARLYREGRDSEKARQIEMARQYVDGWEASP